LYTQLVLTNTLDQREYNSTNVKVIENFGTFLKSTNTPSSNQRFRSYGHWKLGEVSVLDRSNYLNKFGL
jgi:hypothetical protein